MRRDKIKKKIYTFSKENTSVVTEGQLPGKRKKIGKKRKAGT